MTHERSCWLIAAALAAGLATATVHTEAKELPSKQTKQSVDLDYASKTPGIASKAPECSGSAIARHVDCVTTRMDGPQGGTAAKSNGTLARIPVTPVLVQDDGAAANKVFVEVTAETGRIDNIGSFPRDVQIKLRRDLFLAKDLLSHFRHALSEQERKKLLVDQEPITLEVTDGWDRLDLLKLVNGTIRVAPPASVYKTALGAAEGWLP